MDKIKQKKEKKNDPSEAVLDYDELKTIYKKIGSYLQIVEKNRGNIPLCVFSSRLSCFETIVKYLKENSKKELKEIGEILGRDTRTVWQAYNFSKTKHSDALIASDFSVTIPYEIFKDRRLSILEHIVDSLKSRGMGFSDIARKIARDPRTVWTAYDRSKKKLSAKNDKK